MLTSKSSTLYQQASDSFESLVSLCEELLQATDPEGKVNLYEQMEIDINLLLPIIGKFRQRISETDLDKQTYGPATLVKMQGLVDRFDHLYQVYEEELTPVFSHLLKQRTKKQLEQQEAARKEEEFERISSIHEGRAITKQEEEERTIQRLEHEERKRKQEETEAAIVLLAKITEEETAQRRQELLDKLLTAERDLKEVGFRLYCLRGLRLAAMAHAGNKEFRDAMDPITELAASICRDPELPHVRVIRWLNDQFTKTIGRQLGSTEILLAMGFKLKRQVEAAELIRKARQSYKELCPPSAVSPVCNYPNDELYWILEEPNSVVKHSEWRRWMDRVKDVHSILATIRRDLRNDLMLQPEAAIKQYEQEHTMKRCE